MDTTNFVYIHAAVIFSLLCLHIFNETSLLEMRLEMQKASSTKFIGATAAKLDAPSVKEINKEIDCYLYSE